MPDLASFLEQLNDSGELRQFVNDPRAQFQIRERTYLGAQILPIVSTGERGNAYREEGFAMRSVIASDGTQRSAIPIVKAGRGQSMMVELGANDKGAYLDGADFDALNRFLNSNLAPQAIAQVSNFLTTQVVQPLTDIIEKQRWQAICDAQVIRVGDNDYSEQVDYQNPAGHRVTIGSGTTGSPAGWYDPTHDPLEDIYALADTLRDAGYMPNRMFASNRIIQLLLKHPIVKQATGAVVSDLSTGAFEARAGRGSLASLNGLLVEQELPTIEAYNLAYLDASGNSQPFLRKDALVMVSTESVDPAYVAENPLLEATSLGYVGLGRTAGRIENERTVVLNIIGPDQDPKNPRVIAEGTQMTLPVIQKSTGVGVLNVPMPS